MSAAKRRAKRKIALLVRMDATYCGLAYNNAQRARAYFYSAMMPLAKALTRKGLRARGMRACSTARAKWVGR